jgi:hypothetical protein
MPTVTATKVSATVQTRTGIKVTEVVSVYSMPATGDGTAVNDVIQMVKIPAGATILDLALASTDIDTNGTPLVGLQVGDGDLATRFIGTSTIGRTGGLARLDQAGGVGYKYTVDDTIDVLIQAAAATKAAGTLTMTVRYTMDP